MHTFEIPLGYSLLMLSSLIMPTLSGGCRNGNQDSHLKRRLDENKDRDVIWPMFCDRLWQAGGSESRAEACTMGAWEGMCAQLESPLQWASHCIVCMMLTHC